MKFPAGIRACLWSWDPSSIDLHRDRRLIITQVLNYGRWEDVRWLFQQYRSQEFKEVFKKPGRGQWLPDVLNFWARRLDIRLPKDRYQAALLNIHPVR